jgi:hypothetical protein
MSIFGLRYPVAVVVCALGGLAVLLPSVRAAERDEPVVVPDAAGRVQAVVDSLRDRLGLAEPVTVTLLPKVALVVSVAAPAADERIYRLEMEADFFASLAPDELEAAVAHELGHVWVFTHHPYLQTERLANQIAMRVVSRDSLARLYRKMWAHDSTTYRDLDEILGPVVSVQRISCTAEC